MKCNVGGWDRTLRFVGAAVVLGLGLLGRRRSRGRAAALTFAAIPLLTGLARYCPLNQVLGVNTCELSTRLKRKAGEMI